MRGFEALPDYVWAGLSWSALGLSSPTTARFMSKNGNIEIQRQNESNVDRYPVFDGIGVPPYICAAQMREFM